MNDKPFGIAILGYGGMGSWHAKTALRIDDMRICGTFDIDPKRQEAAREAGLNAYDSMEALLADPEVEAVTVATPNDLHLPLVLAALDAGKNVVCEKPVALNAAELTQMMARAEQRGRLFSIHQNRRWDEDFLVIKKLYDENALGRMFNIESRVHGSRGIPGDWRHMKQHGGGMLLDWGVHLIDQILFMVGSRKLESIYADLHEVTTTQVDDGFFAMLHFEGNLTVKLEVGTSNFISLPRWYAQGENGTAIIENWQRDGKIVMVSDWEKRDAVPIITAAGLTKTMAPRTEDTIETYPLPHMSADIRDYYENIRAVVREGAELLVQPAQVLRVMRVIDAIFVSAAENRVVEFEK